MCTFINILIRNSADAKVQKDLKRVCATVKQDEAGPVHIVGKESDRNAVIFLDLVTAEKLIASEKDAKRLALMKDRLSLVNRMKTREGYERHP